MDKHIEHFINNYLWNKAVEIGEEIEKLHRVKGDVVIKFIFEENGKQRELEGNYLVT